LLINLGFTVYWLLRKRRYMLVSLIPILGGWSFLSQHINFANNKAKLVVKADSNLRVMSFNAHLFQHFEEAGADHNIRGETVELVNAVNPDIVCVQEFYSRIKGERQFTRILNGEAGFEAYYFEPYVQNELEGYGQAIFSKYPIIHSGAISKHGFGVNRIIFIDIKREVDTLRIYNVHLRSFALQDEDKALIQR